VTFAFIGRGEIQSQDCFPKFVLYLGFIIRMLCLVIMWTTFPINFRSHRLSSIINSYPIRCLTTAKTSNGASLLGAQRGSMLGMSLVLYSELMQQYRFPNQNQVNTTYFIELIVDKTLLAELCGLFQVPFVLVVMGD
jgi:hypothetical protein